MTPAENIGRIGQGTFLEQLDDALKRVAADVLRSGKKGSVSVTLEITQPQRGMMAVAIMESITLRPPKTAGLGTMAYLGDDGELYQRDPRQEDLPFRMIDTERGDARVIDPETGEIRGAN